MTLYNPTRLTKVEACEVLGCSTTKLERLIRARKVKAIRIGGRVLLERKSLLVYMRTDDPYRLEQVFDIKGGRP